MANAMKPPLSSKKALLKWTKKVLKEYGIRPRKKLSQNFVIDPQVIKDILGLVGNEDIVLEVGCGIGTLTYYLSLSNKYVVCVEIDERFLPVLCSLLPNNTDIVIGDSLNHIVQLYKGVIVSNVPYHITSQLIISILKSRAKKAVLVLQREVALRITAKPGSREYGRLTIITQYIANIELLKTYPPYSFYPAPEVSSSLVELKRKRPWDSLADTIEKLTRCLFSERNKKAVKVLQKCLGELPEELLKKYMDLRVKDLSIEDIVSITLYAKNMM